MNNGTQKNVLQRIIAAASEARTSKEIADIVGLSESSVRRRLLEMRETTPKRIYLCGWVQVPGNSKQTSYYRAGDLACVPYPHAEAESKPEPVEKEEDDWVPRRKCPYPVKIRRDWAVAALFGKYKPESACM